MRKPNVEVECKLIARDASALAGVAPALREACSGVRYLGRELIEDAYLDTRDWRLFRAGYACRIRRISRRARGGAPLCPANRPGGEERERGRAGRRGVLTLKALTRPRRMVSIREELERVVPLGGRGPAGDFAEALPHGGALGRKICGLLAGRKARVIFRIRNRRETYAVRFGGGACRAARREAGGAPQGRSNARQPMLRASVSLDDFVVLAGGRSRRFAEVEIEIKSGTPAALRRLARALARRLGLGVESRAKFQQGLALAGLKPASA